MNGYFLRHKRPRLPFNHPKVRLEGNDRLLCRKDLEKPIKYLVAICLPLLKEIKGLAFMLTLQSELLPYVLSGQDVCISDTRWLSTL